MERERRRRAAVLADVFAEDAVYTDPLASVEGRDGLDATTAAVQAQFGGLVFGLGPTTTSRGWARRAAIRSSSASTSR